MSLTFLVSALLLPTLSTTARLGARFRNVTLWTEGLVGTNSERSSSLSSTVRVQKATEHTLAALRKRIDHRDALSGRLPHFYQLSATNATKSTTRIAEPDCMVHTGGTCMIANCDAWRGPTTCDFGRCVCQPGYCADASGTCTPTRYTNLGTYSLRNMRWPKYVMTGSTWGSELNVVESKVQVGKMSYFVLWQMADGNLLFSSAEYPDYFLTIVKTEGKETNYYEPRFIFFRATTTGAEKSVPSLTLRVYGAPDLAGSQGYIMISSFMYQSRYMYVGSYSWSVDTYGYDPGQNGYWLTEGPPLPMKPVPYSGPRCVFDCSNAHKNRGTLAFLMMAGLASAVSLLF